MTQSPHQTIVATILAAGTMFLLSTHALAQRPTELPPSLRASQALSQQSTGVIDQLLQGAKAPAPQSVANSGLAANGLRGPGQHERQHTGVSHRNTVPPRSSHTQREMGQASSRNTSVDPASFSKEQRFSETSDGSSSDEAWDRILRSSSATAKQDAGAIPAATETIAHLGNSFIEQEKADPTKQDQSTAALIKKISINLMFVLAIAFGFLMLVKQWQKGRGLGKKKIATDSKLDALNVSQVLPLTNGASLHVVQGNQNKFLVAIDASGIKSVNVLGSSFDDTMKRVETRQQRRESNQQDEPTTYKFVDPNEDASEIDEKLIKMLLQRTPSVA